MGAGRYDTLPGPKPRQAALVTAERDILKKHNGAGRREHRRMSCVYADVCCSFVVVSLIEEPLHNLHLSLQTWVWMYIYIACLSNSDYLV